MQSALRKPCLNELAYNMAMDRDKDSCQLISLVEEGHKKGKKPKVIVILKSVRVAGKIFCLTPILSKRKIKKSFYTTLGT